MQRWKYKPWWGNPVIKDMPHACSIWCYQSFSMSSQSYMHISVSWILVAAFCICQMLIQKQKRDCSSCLKGCGTLARIQWAVCPSMKPCCKKVGAGSWFTHGQSSASAENARACGNVFGPIQPVSVHISTTLQQNAGQERAKFIPVCWRGTKGQYCL